MNKTNLLTGLIGAVGEMALGAAAFMLADETKKENGNLGFFGCFCIATGIMISVVAGKTLTETVNTAVDEVFSIEDPAEK